MAILEKMLAAILFWTSLGVLAYVFAGFPALVWVLARLRRRPVDRRDILPAVTLITCAYNEERDIRAKVENCLALDYPPDRLEILIVSDGSTDRTNELLRNLEGPRVRALYLPGRTGKTGCQNAAASLARGEVLFFTDATTRHPPEALRRLVRALHDPSVGCVTGRPVFRQDEGAASVGLARRDRFEMALRGGLGQIDSLLGAQDCIYAVKCPLYRPVREDLDGGFVGPLLLLEEGHRTVYEPEAVAIVDRPPPGLKGEFVRRSRIALQGLRALAHLRRLMNPFRHGWVAVSLISTRLLRWLTPVFLLTLLAASLWRMDAPFYRAALGGQALFYALAAAGWAVERRGRPAGRFLSLPLYFCLLAAAAADGLRRLLAGETGRIWETRR